MNYSEEYLDTRRQHIDFTEWLDILWILKTMNVPKDAKIVELGAGEGHLIKFLKKHGYKNVVGYDLLYEDGSVIRADLVKTYPVPADVYISQHFLEHIPQQRVIQLIQYCLNVGWLFIAIVPGHHTCDPTHIVNHYEYEDLLMLIEQVNPPYYKIEPDIMSFLNPSVRDYILIVSKKPIPRTTKPFLVRLSLHLLRRIVGLYMRKYGVKVIR